jgi:hypothetical protein
MDIELGEVIAERRLRVEGEPDRDVRVRIGRPRPFDATESDFYCPFQVVGVGDERIHTTGGIDGVQALELAIWMLPTLLDELRRDCPGLGWEDAPAGEYGFSRAKSAFGAGKAGPPGGTVLR